MKSDDFGARRDHEHQMWVLDQIHEKNELHLEIDRHHRDFKKISEVCDRILTGSDTMRIGQAIPALQEIRNIVG